MACCLLFMTQVDAPWRFASQHEEILFATLCRVASARVHSRLGLPVITPVGD